MLGNVARATACVELIAESIRLSEIAKSILLLTPALRAHSTLTLGVDPSGGFSSARIRAWTFSAVGNLCFDTFFESIMDSKQNIFISAYMRLFLLKLFKYITLPY